MTLLRSLLLLGLLLTIILPEQAQAGNVKYFEAPCFHTVGRSCDALQLFFQATNNTKTPPVKPGSSAKLCLLNNCVSVPFIFPRKGEAFVAHVFRGVGPYRCGTAAKLTVSYWSQDSRGKTRWVTAHGRPRILCSRRHDS